MGAQTGIEWTATVDPDGSVTPGATWNPVRGCTRVSEGCRHCYAEIMAARFSKPGQWGHGFAEMKGGDHRWTRKVELIKSQLTLPLHWKTPRKIFVNSTSDLFHESLPDEAIDRVFAIMALCPQHIFQVLTKRPGRMQAWISRTLATIKSFDRPALDIAMSIAHPQGEQKWPLPNVWIGVSVEDQERADERIPHLLNTPAAVRFISAEPLLGPIDLRALKLVDPHADTGPDVPDWRFNSLSGEHWFESQGFRDGGDGPELATIDWVISGGESGPGARPIHPDWARSLRDQCAEAGTPFFFKQWGEWIDADHWYAQATRCAKIFQDLSALKSETEWKPELPLSFDDAAFLAKSTGREGKYEHHSSGHTMIRVGKSAADPLLDGREHREFPTPTFPAARSAT